MSLVTATFVSVSLGSFPVVPVFTRITLHFVPEPSTFLLLGAGMMAFGLIGRRLARS